MVASKGAKPQVGKSSARTQGTSVTRSEETNTSAAQDGGTEEGEEEIPAEEEEVGVRRYRHGHAAQGPKEA